MKAPEDRGFFIVMISEVLGVQPLGEGGAAQRSATQGEGFPPHAIYDKSFFHIRDKSLKSLQQLLQELP